MLRIAIGFCSFFILLGFSGKAEAGCLSPPPNCPAGTVCQYAFECRNDEPDPRIAFRIYVPEDCQFGGRCPLVVFLHGLGEIGTDNQAQLGNNANGAMQLVQPARQAIQPMIMVAPQCCHDENGQWSGQLNRLIDMLDQIQQEYSYDPQRVYLTGLSMGGGGLLSWISTYNKVFAAVVPIAPNQNYTAGDAPWATTPAWFFHASNDGTAPVANSRDHVAALRDGGGDPIYTEYASGGHGIWTQSYSSDHLFHWLIAQRLGREMTPVVPALRILSPSAGPLWTTSAGAIDLGGNASAGVGAIAWTSPSGSGDATGTIAWAANNLALTTGDQRIRVKGRGASEYASLGGWTDVSDSVLVRTPLATNAVPRVFIVAPPRVHSGARIDLYAHVFDDGLPAPSALSVNWSFVDGPVAAQLMVDQQDDRYAWIVNAPDGQYHIRATASDGLLQGEFTATLLVSDAVSVAIAINAGGAAMTASDGTHFEADQYFTSGSTTSSASGVAAIYATPDDALYQIYRQGYGSWGYDIPIENGNYIVILHFAETYSPASVEGGRVADIQLQDQPVLTKFSAYSLVGQRAASSFAFNTSVTNGNLKIRASRNGSTGERARIDAIEVLRLDGIFSDGFE